MPPLAYFGIESSGLNVAVDLLILFVAVLYIALIYWTYADAHRRIYDQVLVWFATAASFFPFVGTIIYMILRPPEYLEDVRERELEMQAAEARLHQLDMTLCPHCDYRVERDFVRCPSCLHKLKERCVNCARPLEQAWTICPYCEADVPGIPAPRARRRRATAAVESELVELAPHAPATAAGGADEVEEPAAPVIASEPTARPRGSARASRAKGRPRPTS
jgi:heme exporter protein D